MSTTQLNSKALEWLHKFFDAGDAMDVQRWIDNFYAEDAIVQFGNNPEIHGAEAIKAMFESVFPALESMKHEILEIDVAGNKIYQRTIIRYQIKGDPKKESIAIPGFAVFHFALNDLGELEFGKMKRFDVYLDFTPVGQRISEVQAQVSGVAASP